MLDHPWVHQETDPSGGTAGEGKDDRPEWLPENFKAPEDLVKSYDESRREMDRLRSQMEDERAQWTAALEQITANQQTQPPPGQFVAANPIAQFADAIQQARESGDAATELGLQLALQKQMMDQAIQEQFKQVNPLLETQQQADRDIAFTIAQDRVARQYGDRWAEIAPDVNKWLHEHASWLPSQNSPEAFEQVIREGAASIEGAKAAQQLAELEAARNARLSAQTATGGSTTRHPTATPEKQQEWEAVKNAPVSSYSDIARS